MSEKKRRGGKNRLAEIEKPRGFDRGLELREIVGATDYTGDLMFLVRWENCDELDLLPASEVNEKSPQGVISFYEKRCPLNKKAKLRAHANVPIAVKAMVDISKPEPATDDASGSDAPKEPMDVDDEGISETDAPAPAAIPAE